MAMSKRTTLVCLSVGVTTIASKSGETQDAMYLSISIYLLYVDREQYARSIGRELVSDKGRGRFAAAARG